MLLSDVPFTQAQMLHLRELLEDEVNLSIYVGIMRQEGMMPDALKQIEAESTPPVTKSTNRLAFIATLSGVAAACVAFYLGISIGQRQPDTQPHNTIADTPPHNAKITGLVGVEWTNTAPSNILESHGATSSLAIESGLVEVTYASGVKLTLEGPADFLVTSPNSGQLTKGKLVASVPLGAEGFQINYDGGKIIDLGTEFALNLQPDKSPEFGVFDGKIEIHRTGKKPVVLHENQAARQSYDPQEEDLQAIPFNRDDYIRDLPQRDFAWEVSSSSLEERVFDVSHLVWKPSSYKAVFRWINGNDGITVSNVELRHNGRVVASDSHIGTCGILAKTEDSIFSLDLNENEFKSGKWTLHATLQMLPRTKYVTGERMSSGVLQFEEGLVNSAKAEDFIGDWSYRHLGVNYVRRFHSDGTVDLLVDGVLSNISFVGSTWKVHDGMLRITIPELQIYEDHVLRDHNTLIFVNRPYENATKVK